MRLVREALDTLTLPDAVMGVTLRVESVTGNDGAQGDLFDRGFASAPDGRGRDHPAHRRSGRRRRRAGQLGASVARAAHDVDADVEHDAARVHDPRVARDRAIDNPSLTLQLLPSPKVVTVDTQPRRDHDVPVRYLDDNEWHDIVEAAGPDRVSGGQWSNAVLARVFPLRARGRDDGVAVPRIAAAVDGLVSSRLVGLTREDGMSEMTQVTGTFKVMGWEEKPYDARRGHADSSRTHR